MPHKRFDPLPEATLTGARIMLDQGMRERDVAKHFKVSRETLRRHGVAPIPRRIATAEDKAKILAMRANGTRIETIRCAVNFNIDTVNRILRDAGAVKPNAKRRHTRKPAIDPALLALPGKITIRLPERTQRMRQSLRMRGMSDALALREAMRICAGHGT